MINCPSCGKDKLVDTKKVHNQTESNVMGVTFPEGPAVAGKSLSSTMVVQCSHCGYVAVRIEKSVEFLLKS